MMKKGSHPSPILVHRLYKLLLKAATPLCHKHQSKLLSETISVFRSEIEQFSQKDRLLQLAEGEQDALEALRYCFRNGKSTDIQACIDIIPQLLRFFRASKIIHQDDLFRSSKRRYLLGSLRSNYNIGAAALLSSKLFTYQRDMHGINFERLHREYLEKSTDYVRRSLNRAILDRRKESKNSLYSEELRRMRVYYMFLSLDRIFWLWDTNHVDVIDRLFPAFAKIRIPSQHRYIGDLSFYANIVNNMPEYGLESYGAVINDAMYIKIMSKPFTHTFLGDAAESNRQMTSLIHRFPTHPGAIPFSQLLYRNPEVPSSVANQPDSNDAIYQSHNETTNSTFSSSSLDTDRVSPSLDNPPSKQTTYTYRISASELDGQHFFADRCYEVVFRYDPETYYLEAVMHLDPNKSVLKNAAHASPDDGRWRVPKGHVIWRVDLSQYHAEEDCDDPDAEEERKHWLYLDREYQGVEMPVPPEFYELPARSDGMFYPAHDSEDDSDEEDQTTTASVQEDANFDIPEDDMLLDAEKNNIFGKHGLVPTLCYVKFRRPPSAKRIADCLLPHTCFPPLVSSEDKTTITMIDEHDPLQSPTVEQSRRSWGAIRRRMQSARYGHGSSGSNNNNINNNHPNHNMLHLNNNDTSVSQSMYRVAKTSVRTFESSTTISASDTTDIEAASTPCTLSMTTVETFYHTLPSYVEVDVRFCRHKEDYSGHTEMERDLDKMSTALEQSLSHANDSQTMNISARMPTPEKILGEAVFVDENTGIAMSVVAMEATRENSIEHDDDSHREDTLEPPNNKETTDFKTLHSELTAEANAERDIRRVEPYVYETVRYGHILDLDGAWIKVTSDGLRPVFHSELFPVVESFLPEETVNETAPVSPSSSVLPTVTPITSAGAMMFIAKVLGEAFHRLGMLRPGYSVLGNGLYGGMSNGSAASASSTGMKTDWLTSNPPTDPLRQRHGHSLRGSQLTMGRRFAWESAYWAALHNYYRHRQAMAEEQYESRMNKNNKSAQKENTPEENEPSS